MPAGRWRTLNVRAEVMERLEEFMEREGIVSPNDAVRLLLERYVTLAALEELVKRIEGAAHDSVPAARSGDGGGAHDGGHGRSMTEKQRRYIERLVKDVAARRGLTIAELQDLCREELGVDPRGTLSREEASRVIEWLERMLEGSVQVPKE